MFEKAHPNIHVTIETIPYNNYQTKLTTEFSSGGGPDIFWVNTPMIASWLKDGVMENLTAKIKAAHINLSQYLPTLVSLHEFGGKLYGLPKDWDTIAYFYNVNYFKQHHITIPASLSWNPSNGGLLAAVPPRADHRHQRAQRAVGQLQPQLGRHLRHGRPERDAVGLRAVPGRGRREADQRAVRQDRRPSTPRPGCQTFQFLSNLMYKWHVALPGAALGTDAAADTNEDVQNFAKGKVAMIEAGDWITSGLPSEVKFPVGVLPFPAGPDGNWTVLNGLIDSINTHSPNQQAAWELEQWLGSPASEKILGGGGYIWPGIPSLDPLFLQLLEEQGHRHAAVPHRVEVARRLLAGHAGHEQRPARHRQPARARLPERQERAAAVSAAAKQANDDLASAG